MPEKIQALAHNTTMTAGTTGGLTFAAWLAELSVPEWVAIGSFIVALISAVITNVINIWYKTKLIEIELKKHHIKND